MGHSAKNAKQSVNHLLNPKRQSSEKIRKRKEENTLLSWGKTYMPERKGSRTLPGSDTGK